MHPVLSRRCVPGVEFKTPSGETVTGCALYGMGGAILHNSSANLLKIAGTDAPTRYEDGGSTTVSLLPDGAFIHYTCDGGFGCYAKIDPTGPKYRYNLSALRYEWTFERPAEPRVSAAGFDLRLYPLSTAVNKTGRYLVSVTPQRIVWIDRASGDVRQVTTTPSPGLGFSLDTPLAISPSGRYVAVGANPWGNTLRVFDMNTCSPDPRPFESTCSSVNLDDLFNKSKLSFFPGRVVLVDFYGESELTFAARTAFLPGGSDTESRQFLMTAEGDEPSPGSAAFLGDSFMSGEGVQSFVADGGPRPTEEFVYLEGTDEYDPESCVVGEIGDIEFRSCEPVNLCHVSAQAWPNKVAFALGLSESSVFACSGAQTRDISHVAQYENTAVATPGFPGSEPQSTSLGRLQPPPERIFVQIGGNDAGFGDILVQCALPGDCSADPDQRREFALRIQRSFYLVHDTLAAIRAEYDRESDIYLVGYPAIVDTDPDSACGNNVRLTSREREFSAQLLAYIEQVGMEAAASAGVNFIALADAIADHQLCDPTPWVNGLTAGDDFWGTVNGYGIGSESYHPRREAHAAFSDAITAEVASPGSGNPEPEASTAVPPVPTWGAGSGDIRSWAPAVDATPGAPAMPRVHAESLEPGSPVIGYYASEPVPFSPEAADEDGELVFTPEPISPLPPGQHMLHIRATAAGGEELHARIPVLVPADGDADVDGIPDAEDGCLFIPAESPADQQDIDGDELSDECDASLSAPSFPLAISIEGTGAGTVTSSSAMISCSPFCEDEFEEGTEVTLTASPDPGSDFRGWRSCDKGGINGRQCTVTVDKAKKVTALFGTAHDLTLSKAEGSGYGKVQSKPAGIVCIYSCTTETAAFREGKEVELLAGPARHFHFVQWGGDCEGAGACELTMGEDHEVTALFEEDPKHLLTLAKEGPGQGAIKSHPVGVLCANACSSVAADFYRGEEVLLEVTGLGKGSTFAGWSGAGCSGAGTCTVTIDGAKEVTASFR